MKINIDIILREVCNYYQLTPKQLFEKTRKREIVRPRQIFYYLSTKYTIFTLNRIGQYSGKHSNNTQDHATVLHAKATIKNDIWQNFEGTEKVIKEISDNLEKQQYTENELVMVNIESFHELLNDLDVIYEEVVF